MLSIHEAATLRAALRYWADEIAVHNPSVASPYMDDPGVVPLGLAEIAGLIERLERVNLRYVLTATGSDKVLSNRLLAEQDIPFASLDIQPLTVIPPVIQPGEATSPS